MIPLPETIMHLHVVHPISKEVPIMINQSTIETLRSMLLTPIQTVQKLTGLPDRELLDIMTIS